MQSWEQTFIAKGLECDKSSRMRLSALMQHLQDAASSHADELGFGYHDLLSRGTYWVLVNLALRIYRLPRWNESVTLRTWPSGHGRMTANREFQGLSQDGQELFCAGSDWMILDSQSGRPKNLNQVDLPLAGNAKTVFPAMPPRLKPFSGGRMLGQIAVPYSAIDVNGHVNNTEYVRWGLDLLKRAGMLSVDACFVQVSFLAEAFEDQELEVMVVKESDGSVLCQLNRQVSAEPVCVLKVQINI